MRNLYNRESSNHLSSTAKKKIKHFSYHPEDKIGKGYSSVVFKGVNELSNETIAIKAIDMKGVKDAISREMLDCQIEALTKLKHPNILRCMDVIREPSFCYIITEYCNEGDLSSFLKKKRKVNELEVLKLMKDIVAGFIEMSESQYLHRDLKLANILLSKGRAVIADFGFAKKHSNVFEKQKYNVGSPLYMSPEALKRNIYSVKNDIWSIGIMLYELLHGETPWECKTEKELIEKMIRVPVRMRESLNLSEEMKQFVRKCLEVNEEQRMSLADLKEWNNNNSYESLAEGSMVFLGGLSLGKKPCSQKENGNVLSELTNRVSSRSQSSFGNTAKFGRQTTNRQNTSLSSTAKENPLKSKSVIQRNNGILILQINSFRLLYKIYEKLRKYLSEQRELSNAIGNEIIRRVSGLMSVVLPDQQNVGGGRGQEYGLLDVKNYLNEASNASIKKYKSVVKDYHRKYCAEIALSAQGRQMPVKGMMRECLTRGGLLKERMSAEESVMFYWMIEFVGLEKDAKKDYLDGVIEARNVELTRSYLSERIGAL